MKANGRFVVALALALHFGIHTCSQAANIAIHNKFDQAAGRLSSLRAAIAWANQSGRNNRINLARGTYYLIDADSINVGDLDITKGDLTIIGPPGMQASIDASDFSLLGHRVFHIWPGAHLKLVNLVITGGRELFGGGILNEGRLTVEHCIVTGNTSDIGDGGGIYNTGTLTVNNSAIQDNSAATGDNIGVGGGGVIIGTPIGPPPGSNGGNGGGIYNAGSLVMNNSTVTGNSAGGGQVGRNGGNGGNGGGIFNVGDFTLARCTVSGNSAGDGGNGIDGYFVGDGGNGGSGGGIFNASGASHARLIHTSVTANVAGQGGIGGIYDNSSQESGSNGSPGVVGSGPNLSGNFTIRR